jgi:hypothetical protein
MYKFKKTFKLDDHSGATVEVLVDENDRLSVRAVDLIGDAWHHCLEALERAAHYERKQRTHDRNREIRAALTDLTTHLDGVVCGLCKCLKQRLSDFRPPVFGKRQDCTLAQKITYVTEYVTNNRGDKVPALDLTFKVFRDLLVHPYAVKSLPADAKGHRKEISQGDAFDLTIDEVRAATASVDEWLGAVTAVFEYPRGYDTQRLAEDFAVIS